MNRTQKRHIRGFSLVEVLVALVVFSIAAMGMAALHKVSMDAAVNGRERTTAANLSQHALAWLQNEAGAYVLGEDITNYPLIEAGTTGVGTWQLLAQGENEFRYDEHFGNSTEEHYAGADGLDTAKFCVEYMINQYQTSDTDADADNNQVLSNLYLATVRVTWPRPGQYKTITSTWFDCGERQTLLETKTPPDAPYHQLLVTQVLTTDYSNKI